jgi:hypothetical protein
MPNIIEVTGTELLKEKLLNLGYKVEKSDNKTFDLKVNGRYAEVKTKNKPFNKLDFISLTNKQYGNIQEDFKIFLVCNVEDVSNIEFYELSSRDLLSIIPKKIVSYEYNKGELYKINKSSL